MTTVPLLDLKAQYASIRADVDAAMKEVAESQWFIGGPKVATCEEEIAKYSNCEFGIGVSSGTDALLVCLMSEGIGPGDEVITTPYSFFATAGCIARVGATPVFVDIDPVSYNLDVSQIASRITPKTKAIIPVHLFGQMADMDGVMDIARAHKLCVIEDAAQAIGSEYKEKRAGSIGHYGCFSFFPSKNLGAFGDGGMVVTRDEARADRVRRLRSHGSKPKYYHALIGGNFRLDALQAAVVSIKLRHLDAWTEKRQANAKEWTKRLEQADLVGDGRIKSCPVEQPERRHIYNQYVLRCAQRDAVRTQLREQDVGSEIYYPLCLHQQECFAYLGHKKGDFPIAERAAAETLAIPVYPELSAAQKDHVIAALKNCW